ncbi:hypothetical protein COW77_01250 [Candidatus Wolfebacteria bacterium CG18_big_fil_WC_8_21_14_2_50_39_7]|uniref:Uncharacterized protein n=1 Tax=Candidatus Wolfebacteria bacterium CG18_big_fil_WC_8_21_14_2_50_39_7 TaxID=1975071 RepID=A0A2H0ECN1_9BACT|nr:MAG: hypothetical protein COW77_01250 [Candidatus Wolfebacteria bacterium CG18_big_fil_WC_8_21_14_2_50_39_7]
MRKDTVKRFIKRTKNYQKRLKKGLLSREKFNSTLQFWLNYAYYSNSWRLRRSLEKRLKVKFSEY